MTARVLPAPDTYAACPGDGGILAYYRGVFEAVFVLLHPFIQPVDPDSNIFKTDTDPSRHEINAQCKAVPWSDVLRISGLRSIAELDVALRTQIHGLRKEHAREDLAQALGSALDMAGMIPPTEGEFPDLLHDQVLSFMQARGHDWVWVGDEFCTERKLHWIEDLKGPEFTVPVCGNIFTPDKRILWTTHWDSHFSFFCASADVITALQEQPEFEGFLCTEATQIYWSLLAESP